MFALTDCDYLRLAAIYVLFTNNKIIYIDPTHSARSRLAATRPTE